MNNKNFGLGIIIGLVVMPILNALCDLACDWVEVLRYTPALKLLDMKDCLEMITEEECEEMEKKDFGFSIPTKEK